MSRKSRFMHLVPNRGRLQTKQVIPDSYNFSGRTSTSKGVIPGYGGKTLPTGGTLRREVGPVTFVKNEAQTRNDKKKGVDAGTDINPL